MADTVSSGPVPQLVAFGRELRARGLPVGTGRILTFVRAVAALGLTDRTSLYWAGRTSLVARRDDLATYDLAFDDWYRSLGANGELAIELSLPAVGPEPSFDWGDEPDGLEVTVRVHGRRMAQPRPRGRRGGNRRRELDPDRGERQRGAADEVVRPAHRGRARPGVGHGAGAHDQRAP